MITFNAEKCTGCRLCSIACSGSRIGVFSDTMANIGVTSHYKGDELVTRARLCDQCGTCISVCPGEALSLTEGFVALDQDKCTSCGLCVESCPQKVIFMWEDHPVLCNLCGNDPWCIKMCAKEALSRSEVKS